MSPTATRTSYARMMTAWGWSAVDELPQWDGLTSEERRAIVKDPWLVKGESADAIARRYFAPGVTRNQIIGIVHRSPWGKTARDKPPSLPKPVAAAKPHINRSVRAKPVRHQTEIVVRPAGPRTDWVNEFRPPIEGYPPISLLELPNKPGGKCRFPVMGGYCGIGTGDDMYCGTHSRIMYRNPGEQDPEE